MKNLVVFLIVNFQISICIGFERSISEKERYITEDMTKMRKELQWKIQFKKSKNLEDLLHLKRKEDIAEIYQKAQRYRVINF